MLIEWRIFSFAFYVWGFYYVVVDFLRGKFAEKAGFERFWNNDFLFDNVVVKDLSISDDDLSNDIIDVVLNLNDWCDWMMNFFWFVNRTNDLMFLFIPRLLYNEIVILFLLILFITSYLYNKLIQKYDNLIWFLIKVFINRFFEFVCWFEWSKWDDLIIMLKLT